MDTLSYRASDVAPANHLYDICSTLDYRVDGNQPYYQRENHSPLRHPSHERLQHSNSPPMSSQKQMQEKVLIRSSSRESAGADHYGGDHAALTASANPVVIADYPLQQPHPATVGPVDAQNVTNPESIYIADQQQQSSMSNRMNNNTHYD